MNKHLFSGLIFGLGLVSVAPAAVEVLPFRVEETRAVALLPDSIGRSPTQLRLTLSLKGPEADSSVKYGNLHIDQAQDDQGTDLIPKKDEFQSDQKFQEYSNAFFRKNNFGDKTEVAAPQIDIGLGLPKRSATKIAHLRGSLELAQQGTIKTVEVADIATPAVKKLALPAEAGVQITTTVKADDKTTIGLEITGDENAIESIEVVNAKGETISNGMSSWSTGDGPAHESLGVQSPLDGTTKLVVKLGVDRKITKVPFDLKDIALP